MSNPVVVAKVSGLSFDVVVEVAPVRGEDAIELPDTVAKYVSEFKRKLESVVNLRFKLICGGRADYDVLTYVAVTNEVLRAFLPRLSEDYLNIAYSIDCELGLLDHVPALRLVSLVGTHYAWRRGEQPVDLGESVEFRVRSMRRISNLPQPFLDVGKNALAHIAGKSSIVLAKAIAEGDTERIRRVVDFVNGLWYSTYGLKVPCGEYLSLYVPGLNEVYCVELDLNPRIS